MPSLTRWCNRELIPVLSGADSSSRTITSRTGFHRSHRSLVTFGPRHTQPGPSLWQTRVRRHATMSTLPIELVRHILTYAAALPDSPRKIPDYPTLVSAALVSHAFAELSQELLWQHVVLRRPSPFSRLNCDYTVFTFAYQYNEHRAHLSKLPGCTQGPRYWSRTLAWSTAAYYPIGRFLRGSWDRMERRDPTRSGPREFRAHTVVLDDSERNLTGRIGLPWMTHLDPVDCLYSMLKAPGPERFAVLNIPEKFGRFRCLDSPRLAGVKQLHVTGGSAVKDLSYVDALPEPTAASPLPFELQSLTMGNTALKMSEAPNLFLATFAGRLRHLEIDYPFLQDHPIEILDWDMEPPTQPSEHPAIGPLLSNLTSLDLSHFSLDEVLIPHVLNLLHGCTSLLDLRYALFAHTLLDNLKDLVVALPTPGALESLTLCVEEGVELDEADPRFYSYFDGEQALVPTPIPLAALKDIDAFAGASPVLRKLRRWRFECMQAFAQLVLDPETITIVGEDGVYRRFVLPGTTDAAVAWGEFVLACEGRGTTLELGGRTALGW